MNYIIDETNTYNEWISLCDDMEEINNYKKYYRLYEYTDKICHITNSLQYPNMLNYVKTGLLTEEEMIQALLYK